MRRQPALQDLDDGQKRRRAILAFMSDRFGGGWRHRGYERSMDRGNDQHRGF
jgi:hypothetical protein